MTIENLRQMVTLLPIMTTIAVGILLLKVMCDSLITKYINWRNK